MLPRYHPRFAGEPARLIALTRRIRRILRRSRGLRSDQRLPGEGPHGFRRMLAPTASSLAPEETGDSPILACTAGQARQFTSEAVYHSRAGIASEKTAFSEKNGASRAAAPFCRRGGPAGPYRSRRGKSAGRFRQCASGTVSFRRLMIRSAQCFSKNSQRR